MRKFIFQNEKFYHVFNRGVDKRKIFLDKSDYIRFLSSMSEFNNNLGDAQRDYIKTHANMKSDFGFPKSDFEKLVDFVCYNLLPNHYHFLIRQNKEKGVTEFMRKFGTGYTKYFNLKNNRSGSLFQGKFKAVEVRSESQLRYLSAYINGNPEIHKTEKAKDWKWSSYLDYLGKRNGSLCDKKYVLEHFKNIKEYDDYTNSVIKESGEIKEEMKKIVFDN